MPAIAIPLAGLTVICHFDRRADRAEGLKGVDDANLSTALVAAGFLGFFLVERLLVLHNRDEAMAALAGEQVGILGAAGLSIHSFLDGLGIGFDSTTGLLVFLAVISHDFADGLNTVSYVLRRSGNRSAAVRWLTIDALAPLLGAIVGTQASISDQDLGYVLCVYCGIFLYIGAADLLPEAHAQASWGRVALTAAGFALIFAVTRVAGI
jgi:ZIP family zinc transporter